MSVVSVVNEILTQAIKARASDIHFEPTDDRLRVRFRIDGVLYDQPFEQAVEVEHCISRLKILGSLDIAEHRIPQDGKFQFNYNGQAIDVRVATFPSDHGEKVVLRILDRSDHMISLSELGFTPEMLTTFITCIEKQQGFMVVTGPTGSGKTTTLYAALAHINAPEKHIVTLEDPIEYHLEGVTQGHINPEAGFTFERGIRAMLRQDPDVMMVGEIRDTQTASVAIEAALTGHLVLSTLHTNDAPGALMRLMDMGVEPFLLNAALSGICAQRLARKLCNGCKVERTSTKEEQEILRQHNVAIKKLFDAPGCPGCENRGVKGRTGIFQLMCMTDSLRSLVTKHPDIDAITKQAYADAMQTLLADGLHKVQAGVISLAELMRVTQ